MQPFPPSMDSFHKLYHLP